MKGAYIWKHIAAYEARDTADEHWALGRAMTHVSTMSQCTAWAMTLWNQIWWALFSDYLTFMNVLLFMDGNKANKDPKRLWGRTHGLSRRHHRKLSIYFEYLSVFSLTPLFLHNLINQHLVGTNMQLPVCTVVILQSHICEGRHMLFVGGKAGIFHLGGVKAPSRKHAGHAEGESAPRRMFRKNNVTTVKHKTTTNLPLPQESDRFLRVH